MKKSINIYETFEQSDGTLSISESDMTELKKRHSPTKIYAALLSIYELTKQDKGVEVEGQTPCPECSGINFLRTGNCHVCITCGASQGCS